MKNCISVTSNLFKQMSKKPPTTLNHNNFIYNKSNNNQILKNNVSAVCSGWRPSGQSNCLRHQFVALGFSVADRFRPKIGNMSKLKIIFTFSLRKRTLQTFQRKNSGGLVFIIVDLLNIWNFRWSLQFPHSSIETFALQFFAKQFQAFVEIFKRKEFLSVDHIVNRCIQIFDR